jgi:hypothetical protein
MPNIRGLEIGVFQGKTTCWLLDNIFTHPTSTLDAVDTFEGSERSSENSSSSSTMLLYLYDTFIFNTQEYGIRIKTHRMKSAIFLRSIPLDERFQYDFIYIDGDHRSTVIFTDMVLSWPLLKIDGVMILNNYGDTSAIVSIDNFGKVFVGCFETLYVDYQLAIKKLCDV